MWFSMSIIMIICPCVYVQYVLSMCINKSIRRPMTWSTVFDVNFIILYLKKQEAVIESIFTDLVGLMVVVVFFFFFFFFFFAFNVDYFCIYHRLQSYYFRWKKVWSSYPSIQFERKGYVSMFWPMANAGRKISKLLSKRSK